MRSQTVEHVTTQKLISDQNSILNLSPVKPIDISACQEECANTFGFDFDIKFCKMPETI